MYCNTHACLKIICLRFQKQCAAFLKTIKCVYIIACNEYCYKVLMIIVFFLEWIFLPKALIRKSDNAR